MAYLQILVNRVVLGALHLPCSDSHWCGGVEHHNMLHGSLIILGTFTSSPGTASIPWWRYQLLRSFFSPSVT
jgi:hypothetical protein